MYRASFFDNEVTTTMTTGEAWSVFENDIIRITLRDTTMGTTGGTTEVLYQVKQKTYQSIVITPYAPVDYSAFFPTRLELNDQAARRGAVAQEEKHRRIPKKALVLRSSYQGMARLPCYRGTRPR